jgi:hypothetical protein
MQRIFSSLQILVLGVALSGLLAACTPEHEYEEANAVQGTFPVDSRDMVTSAYRPLNGLQLGANTSMKQAKAEPTPAAAK